MSSSTSSLEARLAALETKLGVAGRSNDEDAEARLAALQGQLDKFASPQYKSLWKESFQLLEELDPSIGLTHQQQPLLYKRQQVLAASETLGQDMAHLAQILQLLSLKQHQAQNQPAADSQKLRLDDVTQAPILTSISVSSEEQRRLDALRVTLEDLNARAQRATLKLQQLLETYHVVVAAASEKCILADEMLAMKEQQKQ